MWNILNVFFNREFNFKGPNDFFKHMQCPKFPPGITNLGEMGISVTKYSHPSLGTLLVNIFPVRNHNLSFA